MSSRPRLDLPVGRTVRVGSRGEAMVILWLGVVINIVSEKVRLVDISRRHASCSIFIHYTTASCTMWNIIVQSSG